MAIQTKAGEDRKAGIGELVQSTGKYGGRLTLPQKQDRIQHSILEGKTPVDKSIVIAGALQDQGYLRAYSIVGTLDKGRRLKRFFFPRDHVPQEHRGVFETAVAGTGDDRIGHRQAGLHKTRL